jgi:hypothetical protein
MKRWALSKKFGVTFFCIGLTAPLAPIQIAKA